MVKLENTLAKHITAAGESAAYDSACKRLLANKIILAWIMKSCLEEYRECDVKEIAEKYIEGTPQIAQEPVNPDEIVGNEQIQGMNTEDSTIHEGTITYDIRFQALVPGTDDMVSLFINIEAQSNFYPGYPIIKRAIYYCSRMISSQYGTEFTAPKYDKIKKVCSIWLCKNPPEKRKNTINRYSITEEKLVGNATEAVENYDLLSAVMLCMSGESENADSGILKLLEVLLSSEREADEKKKILQEEFSIEMDRTFESEVQLMCNLSKGVEEKGRREGRQEGRQEGVILSLMNLMKNMKLTKEQAMGALGIPESEREEYTRELAKK